MQPYAIFLFNLTPNMAKPWADDGVLCYLVDIQHPPGEHRIGNMVYVGADARHWVSPHEHKPVIVVCNPPCTDLAVSGARWFRSKGLRRLSQAIELFAASIELVEWAGCPFLIENPVSTISSYWRKPDHTFHPWEYAGYLEDPEAENTSKQTCLWTGGASSCRISVRRRHHIATTAGGYRPATIGPIYAAQRRSVFPTQFFYTTNQNELRHQQIPRPWRG